MLTLFALALFTAAHAKITYPYAKDTRLTMETAGDVYFKEGVFRLAFDRSSMQENGTFSAQGEVEGRAAKFACKYKRKWRVTK